MNFMARLKKLKVVTMKHHCMITYLNGFPVTLRNFEKTKIRCNILDLRHPRDRGKQEDREKVAVVVQLTVSGTIENHLVMQNFTEYFTVCIHV